MKTVILKKSELAKLKGLGNTHEMVAKKFGVKESEVKDAMMTFGLSKAKPKAKKELEYNIVLENDVEESNISNQITSVDSDTAVSHL